MMKRYQKALIKLYARVHELEAARVEKRLLALEIQEELLRGIVRAEGRVRKARELSSQIKHQLSKRGNTRLISEELRKKRQAAVEYFETQKRLILTLKSIGDSVAFIFGDRHELKQLRQNGDPGFICGKKGTRLERAILRKTFKWGAAAVMNDLTNTLRHADVTIFRPDLWPEGGSPVFLVEAKSGRGGNKKRAERQIETLNSISEYLRTDVATNGESGSRLRVAVRDEPVHHKAAITRLAQNLQYQGFMVEEVEHGLYYCLIDGNFDTENLTEVFSPIIGNDRIMALLSVNDQREAMYGYYPFPLLIRDPHSLFRFYNGEFVVYVAVDIGYVNDIISTAGIAIELADDTWKTIRTVPDDDWGERHISNRAINLLSAEFISLKWLIDNIITGPLHEAMNRIIAEHKLRDAENNKITY